MKNVSLIAQLEGETQDVNRRHREKLLIDRPRYSSETKYGGAILYVTV